MGQIYNEIQQSRTTTMDLVPPIHMTSTFKFHDSEHGAGVFDGSSKGYAYTRISNPTVDLFQEKLALLEGGEAAVATSSGMAAIAAVAIALAGCGNNFFACNAVYGGTFEGPFVVIVTDLICKP